LIVFYLKFLDKKKKKKTLCCNALSKMILNLPKDTS
jgi:hypothetical protein